jgi:D-glycero-alpha-D-manno-heptose-7-phosphate kinase
MIISRTPFRVSFFGGGTDYPGWYLENGGAVLATAIDKFCYISCRYLPPFFKHRYRIVYSKIELVEKIAEIKHPAVKAVLDYMEANDGIEVHHDGDLPARSGLDSSSSFTVGMVNALKALKGEMTSSEDLASKALHIEQEILKENVGSQDQVTAAFGGFNKIEFHPNGTFSVLPIIISQAKLEMLQSHLMLFFTGFERFASDVAKEQIANIKDRKLELIALRQMVEEGMKVLTAKSVSVDEFGKLLHEGWVCKRKMSSKITTPEIDEIYEAARSVGAVGGKLLGAGSGGFFLLFVPPEFQRRVREKLKHLIHVPFKFESTGSKIVLYQPDGLK